MDIFDMFEIMDSVPCLGCGRVGSYLGADDEESARLRRERPGLLRRRDLALVCECGNVRVIDPRSAAFGGPEGR